MNLPEKLIAVIEKFKKFPGVGEKTALRQAMIISRWSDVDIKEFSEAIKGLTTIHNCSSCGFFSDSEICEMCLKDNFDHPETICIVESVSDCMAIDRSQQYRGKYFVLHGVLNPLFGVGPEQLKIPQLIEKIIREGIKEVILAINPSVEGDATCSYIHDLLPKNLNVERIGFGVPIGGSLEYLDSMTISMALENKRKMK